MTCVKQSRKYDLDQLIEETVHEQLGNTPPAPLPMHVAWERLHEQLSPPGSNRKAAWRKRYIYAASLVSAFILLFVFSQEKGLAFARLTEMFQRIEGTVVHVFTRSGDAMKKTDAPSSDEFSFVEGSEVVSEQLNLEEAQQVAAFQIKVPQTLPQGFRLKNVTVLRKHSGKSEDIFLHFEGNQRGFVINEKLAGEQFGSGTIVDQEDTQVEQTAVNGQKASILLFKNGVSKLIFVTQSYYYSIEGQLTKEELLLIAQSL